MQKRNKVSRRNFVKTTVAGAIGASIPFSKANAESKLTEKMDEPKIKEFRRLGRTDFKVSDISFGAGGLTNANVFEKGLDMGINYIDTANHYARGRSEKTIGEVLKNRDRKSVFLTTKLNLIFGGTKVEEIRSKFYESLERLQTDYVDCFMIHMTSEIEQIKSEAFHKVAEELKADGKVRFLGLSNHGMEFNLAGQIKDPMEKVIMAAVDDGRFDVALFVYNFIQKKQGERIIKKCKEKDVGVTLMKVDPVNMYSGIQQNLNDMKERGSEPSERYVKLVKDFENFVKDADKFKEKYGLKSEIDVREAAIKFVLTNKDVHCVCPSINSFEDLDAFISLSGKKLTPDSTALLRDYKSGPGKYYCRHACNECESACPQKIPVNTIMRYNHYFEAFGREKHAMQKYAGLNICLPDKCLDCTGLCEIICPNNVPVRSLLISAHQNLTV